jgi:glycosyltransferase involved in cell wall biosynthesis
MTSQMLGAPWPDWRPRLPASSQPRHEGGRRIKGLVTPTPLISYLTVTRNAGDTVERTIRSVMRQRSSLVEHIVIDGQSTDDTLAIIKRYESELDYYVSEPDGSLYEAINKGIQVCRGAYICVLNADDWLTPRAVQFVAERLTASRNVTTVHAFGAWKVGKKGKNKLWAPRPVSIGDYLRCADLCHNSLYVPRHVYQLAGPYDVSLRIAADFKWMMTALDAGANYMTHRRPTVFYSLGGISANAIGHARDSVKILNERFPFLSGSQADALFTRFHTFKDNVSKYGAAEENDIKEIIDSIPTSGSSEREDLKSAIEDAIQSEAEQGRKSKASRQIKKRFNDAFQKVYWRFIDQQHTSKQ